VSVTTAAMFHGRARWLLWPSIVGTLAGGLTAVAYLWAALRAEAHQVLQGGALALLTLAVMLAASVALGGRRLRTMRGLASGELGPTEANLVAAILEVRALPEWQRRAATGGWINGGLVVALALWLSGWVSGWGMARVVLVAAAIGMFVSVLVYLLALRRARGMVELICRLVPAKSVLAALETEKEQRLRTRLAAFTVLMVVLPAVLVSDASRLATHGAVARVKEAPAAEQAERAKSELQESTTRVVVLAALLFGLALLAGALLGQGLAGPLRHVADEANRISRGDLRQVDVVPAEGELWAVTSTFTRMQAQLQEIIGQMQRAGISIGATTEQLMATSSKYESGAADQATSLNETSATTEELAQSARQISHNAGSVSELAQKTFEAAREGQDSAKAFVNAVDRMRHDNNSIAEAVTRLQKRVQQIGRIVEFITTIADRSDLLALSAELEGTKAGDVGRGFTLVAAEMRRLAENVIESTNEIEELISEIREATHETVAATERGMEHTESGTALATAVSQSLQSVVGLAQSTSDSVRAISLATQQQQTSTDQLAEAMADILGITQQSLAATKQVTSANHELISLSADLKGLVEQFRVKQ
jgi:methyl-accepting chemotaxis protein